MRSGAPLLGLAKYIYYGNLILVQKRRQLRCTLKIVKLFQQNLVHHPLIVGCTVWEPNNVRNFAESVFFNLWTSGGYRSYKHVRTKKTCLS